MDFKENENIGTMDVLDRHQFDKEALTNFMEENVEGFEGPLTLSYTHLTLPTKRIV